MQREREGGAPKQAKTLGTKQAKTLRKRERKRKIILESHKSKSARWDEK